MIDPFEIVKLLKLIPHPEGGYYREVYRSGEILNRKALPSRYKGDRPLSTSIYYMLIGEQISHFHRLKSDEIWHFNTGTTIILHLLDEKSGYQKINLGNNLHLNERPQCIIKQGIYFSAELTDKNSFALIGCTVAPGFDFDDFEFANVESLIKLFPDLTDLIKRLSKHTIL